MLYDIFIKMGSKTSYYSTIFSIVSCSINGNFRNQFIGTKSGDADQIEGHFDDFEFIGNILPFRFRFLVLLLQYPSSLESNDQDVTNRFQYYHTRQSHYHL